MASHFVFVHVHVFLQANIDSKPAMHSGIHASHMAWKSVYSSVKEQKLGNWVHMSGV